MNFIVDKARALKKWSPILEALNVTDTDKREWMSEYAEMHQMNENVAYTNLQNLYGMGAVSAPVVGTTPGSVWQSGNGAQGSGDVAQNLLPVSMKIAAQTIGLDLVAVKPTASPRIEMLFVDFKYDNPNMNDSELTGDRPLVFKFHCSTTTATDLLRQQLIEQLALLGIVERVGGLSDRTFVLVGDGGTTLIAFDPTGTTSKQNVLEFLGFSRIDGYPMFRCFRQVYPSVNNTWEAGAWDQTKNTFDNSTNTIATIIGASGLTIISGTSTATGTTGAFGTVTVELISLLEDHIPGFSQGWYNLYKPMTRAQDENTYPGVIGADVFTKSIQVGDIEISSALKRTQIEDIKASTGMDIVQKLESVLINELTQVISKEIVEKVKELARKNRISNTVPKVAGVSKFDFNVDTYLYLDSSPAFAAPGGETTHSVQRKLIAKINNASNFIATDGRVGPAQYLITNGNLASVIQDIAGYTINPVANASKMNTNGQLYPMGTIGGIQVYVDPYMKWDDNTLFLGRKNTVDQPGLVFVPYLMAQSISLISEATWAPRMLIRSRYAVADIGFFPEKQFMSINVTDTHGVLI